MTSRFFADARRIRDRQKGEAIVALPAGVHGCVFDYWELAGLLNTIFEQGIAEGRKNPLPAEMPVSLDRMIECARRELAMRRRVYPKRVEENRMPDTIAEDEINAMAGIVAILIALNGGRSSKQPELSL